MSEKTLSIIVPSYDMEKYLPKCLGSLVVAPELMERLEVLVVNDGSKDRTSEIAHGFEARYPGTFHVIDKPNGHYGSCINAALPTVKGEYVKILDADDRYNTRELEIYLKWIEGKLAGEGPDLLINDVLTSDANRNCNFRYGYNLPKDANFTADYLFAHMPMLQIHAIAYRSRVFKGLGYRQTEGIPYTDLEWDTFPLMNVESAAYCPEAVYHYYVGREGQSMDKNVRRRNSSVALKLFLSAIRFAEHVECNDCKRAYLDRYLRNLMASSYLDPMLALDVASAMKFLTTVDETIRAESKEWYEKASELKYPHRTPFGFHYVAAVREERLGWLYIKAFRLSKRLLDFVRILMMKMRRAPATACNFQFSPYED